MLGTDTVASAVGSTERPTDDSWETAVGRASEDRHIAVNSASFGAVAESRVAKSSQSLESVLAWTAAACIRFKWAAG